MTSSSLAAKMKLKPGSRAGIVDAPDGYMRELGALPAGVEVVNRLSGKFDWLQIFVKNKSEIDQIAPRAIQALKPESILWISFPKGASKIQTDLTRDKGWDALKGKDLKWITLISVNETWSAFSVRP